MLCAFPGFVAPIECERLLAANLVPLFSFSDIFFLSLLFSAIRSEDPKIRGRAKGSLLDLLAGLGHRSHLSSHFNLYVNATMPLERASDSFQSLIKLAYAEHRDLNHFASTSALLGGEENNVSGRSGRGALDGLEYEGGDDALVSSEPTYWQYGTTNFKDYETTSRKESEMDVYDSGKSDQPRGNKPCFGLFLFCNPRGGADDEDDDDDGMKTNQDVERSILLFPPSESQATKKPLRGIIRKGSKYAQLAPGLNAKQRKSLRPALYRPRSRMNHQSSSANKQPKHVRFSPTKTEVRICPLYKMTPEERAQTWWSSEEFDNIKRSMLVLIQPSEIEHLCQTWLAADTENMQKNKKIDDDTATEKKDNVGSKSWWHKYGDSRRGLERYADKNNMQILDSYQEAVFQVLLEQERQRRQCECWWPFDTASFDDKRREEAEKIAKIYMEYTAWSRDLALASGASDADAVLCDFDDSKRKSREYFLLRQIYQNRGRVHRNMPDFMAPRGFQPTGYI